MDEQPVSYSLGHKRQRDEETAFGWYRKPLRDLKNDPSWFFFNVLFFLYIGFSSVFLIYLGYELLFGSISPFRSHS